MPYTIIVNLRKHIENLYEELEALRNQYDELKNSVASYNKINRYTINLTKETKQDGHAK